MVEAEPIKIAVVKNLQFYEQYLLHVEISENYILFIQFYAGSKFYVIITIAPS